MKGVRRSSNNGELPNLLWSSLKLTKRKTTSKEGDKTTKKVLTILILTTVLCSIIVNVSAYELISGRWPSNKRNPLYYYVNSEWSEFPTAKTDWNNAGTDFGSFYKHSNPEYAWVYVTIITNSGVSWPGRCILITSGTEIITADIELNNYYYSDLGSNGRRTVCAHEIGHTFSLNDENDIWVLMHQGALERVELGILGPQNDDINGVNAAY